MPDAQLFSTEAEVSVLGALLIDPIAIAVSLDVLKSPTPFYYDSHQRIFEAATALHERSKPVDTIALAEELKRTGDFGAAGGYDKLADLVDAVPTAANVEHYAEIVRDFHQLRALRAACGPPCSLNQSIPVKPTPPPRKKPLSVFG